MATNSTGLPISLAETDEADQTRYDAILVVSFGGPERREDVLPFLENVTRGRNVPREPSWPSRSTTIILMALARSMLRSET